MTKAKEMVLKKHRHAYCCRVFAMLQDHPTIRSTAYFGIFKVAKSSEPMAIGLTESAAWKAAFGVIACQP